MKQAGNLELRVLSGEQAGARARLATDRAVQVSGQYGSDIVLRDRAAHGRRIRLAPMPEGVQLTVDEGEVTINGFKQVAPMQVTIPLYTAVKIGETAIAVGEAGSPLWNAIKAHIPAEPTRSGYMADEPVTAAVKVPPAASRHEKWPARLAIGGVGLSALALGSLAFAYALLPTGSPAASSMARATALLRANQYNSLQVETNAQGGMVVRGRVADAAQKERLNGLFAAAGLSPQWDVAVNGDVASAVREVFRLNGVSAQVDVDASGKVAVKTAHADTGKLAAIEQTAKRDIAGLSMTIANTPPPVSDDGPPVGNDAGKRIASIVPGDPAYVVTADGTRYFPGAMLPTGHTIRAIEGQQIVLERNGASSTLRF
jgi:type III secretion protein D